MSDTLVTYDLDGDVALIGLNRPDKRNALSTGLMNLLDEAVARAGHEAKVGIIFGHGDCFSAGLDLGEAMQWLANGQWRKNHLRPPAFESIARGSIPFIAALQGAVVGGGLELACAAHIRVAENGAIFALPEGQRGIFVGGGGSVRIARILGYASMCDMMLTGRVYSAVEAQQRGLVQYRVNNGQSKKRAIQLARRIGQNCLQSNFAITCGLSKIQDLSYDDGLFFERLIAATTESEETRLRLQDFLEKRAPSILPPRKTTSMQPASRSKVGSSVRRK